MLRMLRSAVFIVPTNRRPDGRANELEYWRSIAWSRYSNRYMSSPKTLGRLARFISSIRRIVRSTRTAIFLTTSRTTPSTRSNWMPQILRLAAGLR